LTVAANRDILTCCLSSRTRNQRLLKRELERGVPRLYRSPGDCEACLNFELVYPSWQVMIADRRVCHPWAVRVVGRRDHVSKERRCSFVRGHLRTDIPGKLKRTVDQPAFDFREGWVAVVCAQVERWLCRRRGSAHSDRCDGVQHPDRGHGEAQLGRER